MEKGIIKLEGARCASCAYAIEHLGKKIEGITDIFVAAGEGKVYVDYTGNKSSLDGILSIIKKLGYNGKIQSKGKA